MRVLFQTLAQFLRARWASRQIYMSPILRNYARTSGYVFMGTSAAAIGASFYFRQYDFLRELELNSGPSWPLLSTTACEAEEEGTKFPPAKLEVPGVLPLGLAAHSEDVELSHGRTKFNIDLAVFIDPMPTNLENPEHQGVPEELKILLKPTEPYDRCLVIRTKEKINAKSFVNLLAEQVESHALKKERLERIFDPGEMPKTPPKDALEKLKEAVIEEADEKHSGYLPADCRLAFVWRKEGFLDVRLENKRISLILSPELSWAVFDSFFGPKSIAPDVKDDVVSRMRTQTAEKEE